MSSSMYVSLHHAGARAARAFVCLLVFCLSPVLLHAGPALASAAWLVEWDMANGFREAQAANISDVMLFAAKFDAQDSLFLSEPLQRAASGPEVKALIPNRKVYLTVVNDRVEGPNKVSLKDPALITRLMATPESRARHKNQLLALLDAGPFVGLELDYERVSNEDWPKLLAFAQDLSAKMASKGKHLRFLLEPKNKYLQGSMPDGPEYVLMAYNLYGGHSGPGPKTDGAFLLQLAEWCARMPRKPGLALASGGFAWSGEKVISLTEAKATAWAEGSKAQVARMPGSRALRFLAADNAPGSPVPVKNRTEAQFEVWYADGDTLAYWAATGRKLGFTSVSLWRFGGNAESSLQTFTRDLQ